MVRVNYPTGDHHGFITQTSTEPHTVRTLQPPGGQSSISFSDGSQVRNSSRTPSEKASSAGPSVNTQEPKLEEVSSSPEEDSSNQNGENGKISDVKSSDFSNGAENPTSNECEQSAENLKPENQYNDFPLPKDLENVVSKNTEVTLSDNEVEVEVSESQTSHSEKQSEFAVSEVSVSSRTETSESSKVEVSSVSESKTEEVSNESVNIIKESSETIKESERENIVHNNENNGEAKNRDLPPLHIQRNESSSAETTPPSSSASSPSVKSNEDARNRVTGQPIEKPNPQQAPQQAPPPPRKIKDHMRSNIFMSDEDYMHMPVRSPRTNATATVTDTSKQDMPAAGQRQRIPPGGFSTKLW